MTSRFSLVQADRFTRGFTAIACVMALLLWLVACTPASHHDPTQQGDTLNTEELQRELSKIGSPVVDARATEETSGLSRNLIVSLVVVEGTGEISESVLKDALQLTSVHTPGDYKGAIVVAVADEAYTPVSVEDIALGLGVEENSIAIDETITFYSVDELATLVSAW